MRCSQHAPRRCADGGPRRGHCFVRKVKAPGHDGRLLNPGDVKRIRGGHQKNNMLDAACIAWAWYIPGITFVAAETQAQQDLQVQQRIYQGYVKIRIEPGNRIHALLLEYGLHSPQKSSLHCREAARVHRGTPR
ncbi:hypothetical protein MAF45_08745 [Mesosutterella sp. OilRF-GAM-744-9]|uniref:Transposase IS111A/IS1328/IS1533 N-terminal domain-containing protein n=1 Tax=Mesosutterella porci TaxID=2915351 RepID=A0ABS9MSC8_9BURK|nr:hypothetical protein [Mesosutterella sp. oilRF-744-WT-GAM-9]MCG5031528.1 hypothetical protein [Mesosutterella sp. oilRF-744-WT-GAM-9]